MLVLQLKHVEAPDMCALRALACLGTCLSVAVMAELETLGKVYPFSIPPFFALILRAFSVIEGIALTVDPDYSIVQVGQNNSQGH